ncbi:MAG: hypothetical protein QHI48_07505 [Bacteroidota bacterium]|nr:hypothetical protein [Bacteroidota bacterium]
MQFLFPVFLFTATVSSQVVDSIAVLPDGRIFTGMYLDTLSRSRFHDYVHIGQYYDSVAVCVQYGEMMVLRSTGDTSYIHFARDAADESLWDGIPYYDSTSTVVANPIRSRPFVLGEGDTLLFFREPLLRWPIYNRDSSLFVVDTATRISIPDTVRFIASLIDVQSGAVLACLDSCSYHPIVSAESFFDCFRFSYDSTNIYSLFEVKYRPGSDVHGRMVRIDIVPVFASGGNGGSTGRHFYAGYTWMPSLISDLRGIIHGASYEKEALRGIIDRHFGPVSRPLHTLDISPSVLTGGGVMDIAIHVPRALRDKTVEVSLFDLSGRLVPLPIRHIHVKSEDILHLSVERGSLLRGIHYLFLRDGNDLSYGRFIVF